MFKFNFGNSQETESVDTKESGANQEDSFVAEGREIVLSECHRQRARQYLHHHAVVQHRHFNLVDLKHVELLVAQQTEDFRNLHSALQMDSDVVKGIYEGGLKVWECTEDLLDYLERERVKFLGLRVLDLGCGSGLLGIYSLANGAVSTHFQDYNDEVLDLVTIPNVLNNPSSNGGQSKFFSGDWGKLLSMLESYDVILTSETIYNPDNYGKLIKIFDTVLKEDGVIYIAAKLHYFGVGGDLRQFSHLLLQSGRWQTTTCYSCNTGVKREILKVSRHIEKK